MRKKDEMLKNWDSGYPEYVKAEALIDIRDILLRILKELRDGNQGYTSTSLQSGLENLDFRPR